MEIFIFIIGLITGGIIAYFIVGFYYDRAGKTLHNQIVKLQELNFQMLRKMEEAGLIKWNRDIRGKITGLDIKSKLDTGKTVVKSSDRTLH